MDDEAQQGAADRNKINVNEDYELAYWTRTLEVPEDEVRNAVQQVGTSIRSRQKVSGTISGLVPLTRILNTKTARWNRRKEQDIFNMVAIHNGANGPSQGA